MKNYIDVIEQTLGFELNERNLEKFDNINSLIQLANAAEDFFNGYHIPPIKDQIRPLICPEFNNITAKKLGFDLAFSNIFYNDDSIPEKERMDKFKKILLYANSICIYDPLIYKLDYYRTSPPDNVLLKELLPGVIFILNFYSDIKDLVKENIIIPVSTEMLGNQTVTFNNDEDTYFYEHFKKTDAYKTFCNGSDKNKVKYDYYEYDGHHIKELLVQRNKENRNFDLLLETQKNISIYNLLIKYYGEILLKKKAEMLFFSDKLMSINSINTNEISIKDILKIRKNEDVFVTWQNDITNIIREYYNNQNWYPDLNSTFKEKAKEQLSKYDYLLDRSQYFKKLGTNSFKDVSLNLFGGFLGGVITSNTVECLIASGVSSFLNVIWELYKLNKNSAIKDHYLAIIGK